MKIMEKLMSLYPPLARAQKPRPKTEDQKKGKTDEKTEDKKERGNQNAVKKNDEKQAWEYDILTPAEKQALGDITRIWTPKEIEAMIAAQENGRDRIIVRLIYTAGINAREVVGLRVQDVDFGAKRIHVRKNGTGATRKIRITADMAAEIQKYLNGRASGQLFRVLPGVHGDFSIHAVKGLFVHHMPVGMTITALRYHGALNLYRCCHSVNNASMFLGVSLHHTVKRKLDAMEKIQDLRMEQQRGKK